MWPSCKQAHAYLMMIAPSKKSSSKAWNITLKWGLSVLDRCYFWAENEKEEASDLSESNLVSTYGQRISFCVYHKKKSQLKDHTCWQQRNITNILLVLLTFGLIWSNLTWHKIALFLLRDYNLTWLLKTHETLACWGQKGPLRQANAIIVRKQSRTLRRTLMMSFQQIKWD